MRIIRFLMVLMMATLTSTAVSAELRYLALGDSYTIGEGVAEAERWPVMLATQLRANGIPLADPRIIATTGWTTDELSAAMDKAEPLGRWDLVSLLIGVNNQYRGRTVDDFKPQFSALLDRAIALANGRADRVIVLTIPDWGVTPFAEGRDRARIASELDTYNAAISEICAQRGVTVVDISPLSRRLGADPAMLADDGLHPGGALYRAWSHAAVAIAQIMLAEFKTPRAE